ncbi:hypothetical protein [Leptospira vanthielii]|uniref:Uncharacterized protein n=1 Tax=Leptospira vanthielii TaxID=293085 RepID=A0ABY2NPQ3_9LEPT|nr:hypothetical protein [Leptospira vanthielii]TGM56884.1 hypothetical protein EHQ95_09630 [Leptospira vanthielii]
MKKMKLYSLLFFLFLLFDCTRSVFVMRDACKQKYIVESPFVLAAAGVTTEELNQVLTELLTGYLMYLHRAETNGDPEPRL